MSTMEVNFIRKETGVSGEKKKICHKSLSNTSNTSENLTHYANVDKYCLHM